MAEKESSPCVVPTPFTWCLGTAVGWCISGGLQGSGLGVGTVSQHALPWGGHRKQEQKQMPWEGKEAIAAGEAGLGH